MRIHHLNCISSCPLGGRLMDGLTPSILQRGHLTCHCLLIETRDSLVLVDTGYGLKDVHDPHSRLSEFFLKQLKPDLRDEMTARRQIENLGFRADDVRHILLSHLDFDHAGGLDDFPSAKVHMMQTEIQGARAQKTWLDRQRFRPQQWSTERNWLAYHAESGESWYGFAKVHALEGLPPEILMLPLIGHTLGHAGVAIQRAEGWLLYAGDAYFYEGEMNVEKPHCTPGLTLYQIMMEKDRRSRLWNQNRLRELVKLHGHDIDIFCAHDVAEFTRLAGRSPDVPVRPLPKEETTRDRDFPREQPLH
ncbi:MBL fold metallo-hydrolase [Oligoflexus tunisiensis]|uniref:MBL fold metallo-hydrolase n=1 Tax=Oligoflexus tunisiensis TaxID=708132 RepID=UPI000B1A1CDE|nr:MBL fold metallo-hydrolase [Oligoflexus tunisiensis]